MNSSVENMITGLFEFHFIVDSHDPLTEAHLFSVSQDLANDPDLINPRPTCAQTFYGKYPRQPMLTARFQGSETDAVTKATSIESILNKAGLRVIRLKVEAAAHNTGVDQDHQPNRYFEFHFKVPIASNAEWTRVETECRKFGAHLFFNPYSRTGRMQPVVTLRRYTSYAEAEADVTQLVKSLVQAGFPEPNGIEREYSILDSNVHLDEDWLFRGDPQNFITVA
jgi:hypothetical protein